MTKANSISTRQICFILIAYNAVSKILIYPTNMAHACANDLLFPILFCTLLQVGIVAIICGISARTNETLFALLEKKTGTVFTKIVFFLLALYFVFATIYPVLEQKVYVHDVFYETIPSLFVFAPFFIFSIYVGAKHFNNVGRCADLCMLIFCIISLTLIIMAFAEVDFSNLLPILSTPINKLAGGTFLSLFRFSDSAFLLLFLGHFKYKKGDGIKLCSSCLIGGLIVMVISALYYGIFGAIAPNTFFAISKIGMFFSAIDLVGRVDLLALYILEIVSLFALVLNVQSAVYCLEKVFNVKNKYVLSLAVNVILIVLTVFLDTRYDGVQRFYNEWAWIITLAVAYVLPIIIRMMTRRESREKTC